MPRLEVMRPNGPRVMGIGKFSSDFIVSNHGTLSDHLSLTVGSDSKMLYSSAVLH